MQDSTVNVRERVLRVLEGFLARRGVSIKIVDVGNLEDLGIDSLGIAELVFEIAEEFKIDDRLITDEVLGKMRTFDDLVAAVTAACNTA